MYSQVVQRNIDLRRRNDSKRKSLYWLAVVCYNHIGFGIDLQEVEELRTAFLILQIISALVLIASVLLQSGKSAGLSGSISGGSEAIFGGKKKGLDELLTKVTAVDAGIFLILCLAMGFM